jgi:hypothetical protein
VNRRPDFNELLDGVDDPEERARLQRVHELLVEAGPPPELTAELATPPPAAARDLPWQRPRRLRPRTVLLAGALVTAFLVGYLAAAPDSDQRGGPAAGLRIARTVQLEGKGDATGAVGIGVRDPKGNWPMVVSVWGLEHLSGGDYYTLALTKKGKPIVTCGTFNVSGNQTTVRMTAAYDLKRFEGWVVLLWDAQTRNETTVLSSNGRI